MRRYRYLILGIIVSLNLGCEAENGSNVDIASDAALIVSDRSIHQVDVGGRAGSEPTPDTSRIFCRDATGDERRLCDFLLPPDSVEDQVTLDIFEITTAKVDLNRDRFDELIVWESSWAGTSGGMLWVLSVNGENYTRLLETEMTWTPILVLPSVHHGWRDLSYQVAGGGVDPVFVTVAHNGKTYGKKIRVTTKQPKGEVLIERRWEQTVFGPAPSE